jgi:hypothetical protein
MRGRDINTGRFAGNGFIPADELSEKLEKLAIRWADQLLGERDQTDSDRRPLGEEDLAAWKLLTLYYAQSRRLPVVKPDEDDDTGFGALKDRIANWTDGEAEDAGSRN